MPRGLAGRTGIQRTDDESKKEDYVIDREVARDTASRYVGGDFMTNVGKEGLKRQQEHMTNTALKETVAQAERDKTNEDARKRRQIKTIQRWKGLGRS